MNGLAVDKPRLARRLPLLVQIENNPEARPPSGLNRADMVIESPVEGDTTRFSAVFMCEEKVGRPVGTVRSARYFNIDYWQQMHLLTVHFGAGGQVLRRFNREGMPYANGLRGGWDFFFRRGPRPAPHNVYLDVEAARRRLTSGNLQYLTKGVGKVRAPFKFADDPKLPKNGHRVDEVDVRTASFWRYGWEWDASDDRWLRSDSGEPNHDALDGTRLHARTVIVQVVKEDILAGEHDPGGYPRRYQHLVGEGSGRLYVDGQRFDVHWSRSRAKDRTSWTYAGSGDPVRLPRGRVWWEVVPRGTVITEH